MATWMETPVNISNGEVVGEIGVLLDGPPSEIDAWIVLDSGIWPGASPAPQDALPAPAQPPTGSFEHEDATPPICDVIAAWRAADRELAGLVEGNAEWNRVHAEMLGLRALHHRLFEARMAEFPTSDKSTDRSRFAVMAWGPEPVAGLVIA
jgi:hypothetical protein